MLQKYFKPIVLVLILLLFGGVLYISQNLEALKSSAAAEQNFICSFKYGKGWYAISYNRSSSGYRCAQKYEVSIPTENFFNQAQWCQSQGYTYVPSQNYGALGTSRSKCQGTRYSEYPGSTSSNPTPPPSSGGGTPPPTSGSTTPPDNTAQPASLNITPKSGTAKVGQPFSAVFSAGGSKGLNTWQTTSTFDNGLNFDSDVTNGKLSGTPASSGYKIVSIEVTDYQGTKGKVDYALTINNVDGSKPAGNPPSGFGNNLGPTGNGGGTTGGGGGATGGGSTGSGSADIGKTFYNPLGAKTKDIPTFIISVIKTILGVTGALAVLFIIIGGLRYIISAGNETVAKEAKNTITYAIMGLIFAVMSFAIVTVITNLLINK